MSFSDDEQPPEISSAGAAGPPPRLGNAERVRLVAHCNDKAPLEKNRQQVLLELTDTSSAAERSGLDLLAVLDVRSSMGRDGNWKLDKLKTAMQFVISKLGTMDRLSIVSFSNEAKPLCRLCSMTEAAKAELTGVVETELNAMGSTNMKAGLETGLKVLAGRQHLTGRVESIILMSDGQQNPGKDADATTVPVGHVAVYTFGFGADQDAKVLEAIAGKSLGGTFYDVEDGQNLSEHFSALLAGLLTVVVQDLKLIVREQPGHSKIQDKDKVDAGGYTSKEGDDAGSFVVDFGYLYGGEVRSVIVDLLLPPVSRAYRAPVLTAHSTYSIKGRTFYSPRDHYLSCSISRTGSAKEGAMEEEGRAAEAGDRRRQAQEQPRWAGSSQRERRRSSGWWAWATVLLCTALAVGVILAGAVVFAVYLIYRPSMPYLAVSDARLERLEYGQDGAIDYLQASITVVAVNNNSKADASFSGVVLVVGFHGADVALLRAQPFVVPRESSLPLPYRVVSAGRALDAAGMQAMDEALKAGVVPLDLFGKARTRWKVGVFANLRFWTRVSCRLHFFFPGNGTLVPTGPSKCRSR